jgi:hypothetical protein
VSDEQTPGQPPTDPPPPPVNPYEQQQPVSPDPAAAPGTDPASPPPAPPPYGEPATPQYGQPSPTPPAYGQPTPPAYGQPASPYGQPAMSAGVPAGGYAPPAEAPPSKAMAITALITSLICCTPVGFVLAIIVLRKGKDGRNHGRGLAIAALIISIVFSIGIGAAAFGLSKVDWEDLLPVEQLKTGECLNASNLTDDSEDFVEDIKEVSCDSPHDAEVLVTKELTQDDAKNYDPASSTLCTDLITEGGLTGKVAPENPGIGYFGLTTDEAPNAGDKLVCIGYKIDGSKLDAPL